MRILNNKLSKRIRISLNHLRKKNVKSISIELEDKNKEEPILTIESLKAKRGDKFKIIKTTTTDK